MKLYESSLIQGERRKGEVNIGLANRKFFFFDHTQSHLLSWLIANVDSANISLHYLALGRSTVILAASSDSEVEVVSTYDAAEHELVQLGEYLRLGSDSDKDTMPKTKKTIFPQILCYLFGV